MADDTSESGTTGHSGEEDETRELDGARVVRTPLFDALTFRPGDQIGRFVILRELGSGGMSVVYVAFDPQLDRQIALKLVRPGGAISASESAPRLQREAQALARLSHPNVVHVYDVGTFEQNVYIAMELVDGKTLREWLNVELRPWADVLRVLLEAGEGLAAAHDAGLVHFDFKPGNVLIGSSGRVRVVDFGLAREPRAATGVPVDEVSDELTRSGRLSEPLTEHGAVLGTPGYIAPEHLRGEEADARADQFSFCVTLWQGVYGDRPFSGRNRAALQTAILAGKIRAPPREAGVPAWLEAVLRRGLSVAPRDRYPTLRDLLADLRRDAIPRRRRVGLAVAAAAVVGLGVAGVIGAAKSAQIDCTAGGDRLAVHWTTQSRRDARAAFEATAVPYAVPAWERTEAELDEYTSAWEEAHVEACEATHVRGEQSADLLDRRMACLKRAELEFTALVDVFVEADADLVQNAVTAAQSLEPIARCAEAAELEPEDAPLNPSLRDRVAALQAEVARADALTNAGRYDDAALIVKEVLVAAEATQYAPLIWSAASTLGIIYSAKSDVQAAIEAHRRALAVAEEAGLDYKRGVSLSEHAYVYGNLMGDHERARWFAQAAHAVLDRVGGSKRKRAELLSNEAIVVTMAGEVEEALQMSARAVALRQEAGLDEDSNYATLLGNLGGALYSAGRYKEALQRYRSAYRIRTEQLGETHPSLAVSMENIGNCLQALERNEEALEYHQAALEMARVLGVGGPKLALQYNNVAVALFGMERYDAARTYYHRAVAAYKRGADAHPAFGVALCNLAELELRTGNLDEARQRYEEALELFAMTVSEQHPWRSLGLSGLGAVLIEDGEHQRALDLLRQAAEIHERSPMDELAKAETQLHLGRAMWVAEPDKRRDARGRVQAAADLLAGLGKRARVPRKVAKRWLSRHAVPEDLPQTPAGE